MTNGMNPQPDIEPTANAQRVKAVWGDDFPQSTLPEQTLKIGVDPVEIESLAGNTFGGRSINANGDGDVIIETGGAGETYGGRSLADTSTDDTGNTFGGGSLADDGQPGIGETFAGTTLDEPKNSGAARDFRATGRIGVKDFVIVKKLAAGGMGEVMVAQQTGLNRIVALKRPKDELKGSPAKLASFLREATVNGDLEHPGIVPVYHNGIDETGLPYYAMKLVKGIEWRYLLHPEKAAERKDEAFAKMVADKAARLNLEAHIDILMRTADAVAFAHSRHIVHRDLKPENVMVGDFGEVQVMDWGLAIDVSKKPQKDCKAVSVANIQGPAGTPAYLAPEMALGEKDRIDARTDIYLLGAILYELLTGRPPHSGNSINQVLLNAALNKVPPAREVSASAPVGLSQIAMKAMATAPVDRYPDVPSFQNDIREYLKHAESIRVSDAALKRFDALANAKQNNATTSGQYVKYAEIVAMFRQSLEMWSGNAAATAGLRQGLVAFIDAALDGDDLGLARAQLDELKSLGGDLAPDYLERLKRWEKMSKATASRRRNFRFAVGSAALLLIALIVGGAVYNVKIRNEKKIAEDARERAEMSEKEAVKQKQLAETNEREAIKQKRLAEDNFKIAEEQRTAAEENYREAEHQRALAQKNYEEAERQRTEAETQRAEAEKQRIEAEKNYQIAEEQRGIADAQRQEAETQRALAETNEKEALDQKRLAEANEKEALAQKRLAEENLRKAIFNLAQIDIQRAETLIETDRDYPRAAAHLIKAIDIMGDLDTSAPRRLMDQAFQFSPHLDQTIILPRPAKQLRFGGETIESLRLLYDVGVVHNVEAKLKPDAAPRLNVKSFTYWNGQSVVCAWSGELQSSGRPLRLNGIEGRGIISIAVDASGKRLAVGTLDGFVAVYETADQPPLFIARDHLSGIDCIAFNPKRNEVITAGADGRIGVWDISGSGSMPVRSIRAHTGYVSSLAVSPDGALIATTGDEGAVRLWNAHTLTERATFAGHTREVGALAFHPVRPWLASHSWDGALRIWDYSETASPKIAVLHIPNSTDGLSVAFSPSGKAMACLADGNRLTVWRLDFFVEGTSEVEVREQPSDALLVRSLSDSGGDFILTVKPSGEVLIDGTSVLPDIATLGTLTAAALRENVVLTASGNGAVHWLTIADRMIKVHRLSDFNDAAGVALSADGRRLAVWRSDAVLAGPPEDLRIHSLPSGERIIGAQLSSDGKTLFYLTGNDRLNRFDFDQNCPLEPLRGHDVPVTALASDPTGLWLLTGDATGTVRLWHPSSQRSLKMLSDEREAIQSLAFDPDGRTFRYRTAVRGERSIRLMMPSASADIEKLKELTTQRLGALIASTSASGE
ncbi:MAG: protein kinase [Planctomycetota bacterium]